MGTDGNCCDECHDIVFRYCRPDDRWEQEVAKLWSETAVAFQGCVDTNPERVVMILDDTHV